MGTGHRRKGAKTTLLGSDGLESQKLSHAVTKNIKKPVFLIL
jgi:hypothetical protein